MKTKINILTILISFLAVAVTAVFFSCDNPLLLGERLDISGPVVNITSPSPRKTVPQSFYLEGTITDETGINTILVKAFMNNAEFQRQWRYQNSAWEISNDKGASWAPFNDAELSGTDKSATFKILINMKIGNEYTQEGEYTFNVQAWDKANFTDDNSYKGIVLIYDSDPPKVSITNPLLYEGNYPPAYTVSPLKELHEITDDDDDIWQDPSNLGKFLTQEFELKWQIDENNDVWSFDLRFYPFDEVIDNDLTTPLSDNYIYRYTQNDIAIPNTVDPNMYIKPNGSVIIPDLTSNPGIYNGGGELKQKIKQKTTIKVVVVCKDAAGFPNQEKTLGYYIYWPRANTPWIVFPDGMDKAASYYNKSISDIEPSVYMVYPGRSIKATAFQAHGVGKVVYSLYGVSTESNILNKDEDISFNKIEIDIEKENPPYSGDLHSNSFPWEFNVPPRTGYYVVKAQAFSANGIGSSEYEMLFRVQDINYPDFPESPKPDATDPLFLAVNNNKITITGIVSDATNVQSLCMVWINPESKKYSAMSQLAYFRDKDYAGWRRALTLTLPDNNNDGIPDVDGVSDLENPIDAYDSEHLNRLWKLKLTPAGIDADRNNRLLFTYSLTIDLTYDLNISTGNQPLKSQVFMLRAENPDGKCTIITYAPQGDTKAPTIKITDVIIDKTYTPGVYAVIPKFNDGNTITINGTWEEDSMETLNINGYFQPNFNININNQLMPLPTITPKPTKKTEGTWTVTATVGNPSGGRDGKIPKAELKDTLVIDVNVKDIGGNVSETGCSWMIESDNLRLMRISSEIPDDTYNAVKEDDSITEIEIFLEFSKPVKLASTGNPVLILNSTGTGATARAVYKDGQNSQNSRQYFTYKVGTGHTTGETVNDNFLDVTGLENAGTITGLTYNFAWCRGEGTEYEEVRITTTAGFDGNSKQGTENFYRRTLPTGKDNQSALAAGKHIIIDTTPPKVESVKRDSNTGDYNSGDIYFTVTFNENVKVGATEPKLSLRVGTNDIPADYVRSKDKDITFKYSISPGDTSSGNQISLSSVNYTGSITDIAGNVLPKDAVSTTNFTGARTLTGIYIDTIKPSTPEIRIVKSSGAEGTTANAITQDLSPGGEKKAEVTSTTASAVALQTLYQDNLYLAIKGTNTSKDYDLEKLEYSLDDGNSWIESTIFNNTGFELSQTGENKIKARQTDRAGNVSPVSQAITFTWDQGSLITRINSTNPNGTYTNATGNGGTRVDDINITVYFRKKITFTSVIPQIVLSNVSPAQTITAVNYSLGDSTDSLSFKYTVGSGDNTTTTPDVLYLDVSSFSLRSDTVVARDDKGVRVYNFNIPAGNSLKDFNDIKVVTGPLALKSTNPLTFVDSHAGGVAGFAPTDSSYNTALVIEFTQEIIKNQGTITVIQSKTNYRLPAVLTESQYSKYRNVPNINTYYKKGSNGYINDGSTRGPDTSTKYILDYNIDTAAITPSSETGSTDVQKFAEAFRQAEKIELDVNSQPVRINSSNRKQLIVELTGTNALKVTNVGYEVYYPQGLVLNELEATCPAVLESNPQKLDLPLSSNSVAKPFIRIKKTQDTITTAPTSGTGVPSVNLPYLIATQPLQAQVRMDCRTPGTTINYFVNEAPTTTSAMNWNYNGTPTDLNTPALPVRPSDPSTTTTNRQTYANPISIGSANYQGLQWYVRAKANISGTSNWSVDSEEMAFKTVVTYQIDSMTYVDNGLAPNGNTTANDGFTGDQIWIRGGDAITLSSVPGFPLTWDITEFDKCGTDKKRAGIRLMSLVPNSINATRGTNNRYTTRNAANTANENHGLGNTNANVKVIVNGIYYNATIRGTNTLDIYVESGSGSTLDLGAFINITTVSTSNMRTSSTWKFVTWEINVDTYFDIILGRDTASSANEAWQYGPRQFTYQRAGWTSYKEQCRILPGKHRWLVSNNPSGSNTKGTLNFSGTWSSRSAYTATITNNINQP